MRTWIVLMCLLVALLAACAPAGGAEPTAAVEPAIDSPALQPVPLETPAAGEVDAAPNERDAAEDAAAEDEDAAGDDAPSGTPTRDRPNAPASGNEPVEPETVALGDVTPATPSGTPREAPMPGRPSGDNPAERERALVAATILDLVAALDVPTESVTLEVIEPVTWPDTSLGCPQPGVNYAQVTIEGSRIILTVGGETHTYHTDGNVRFLRCEDGEILTEGIVPRR